MFSPLELTFSPFFLVVFISVLPFWSYSLFTLEFDLCAYITYFFYILTCNIGMP